MSEGTVADVVVVGGGVIGSGIAFELAKRGVKVTLIERGRIGGEASGASAGIISRPTRPHAEPPPPLAFWLETRDFRSSSFSFSSSSSRGL